MILYETEQHGDEEIVTINRLPEVQHIVTLLYANRRYVPKGHIHTTDQCPLDPSAMHNRLTEMWDEAIELLAFFDTKIKEYTNDEDDEK